MRRSPRTSSGPAKSGGWGGPSFQAGESFLSPGGPEDRGGAWVPAVHDRSVVNIGARPGGGLEAGNRRRLAARRPGTSPFHPVITTCPP